MLRGVTWVLAVLLTVGGLSNLPGAGQVLSIAELEASRGAQGGYNDCEEGFEGTDECAECIANWSQHPVISSKCSSQPKRECIAYGLDGCYACQSWSVPCPGEITVHNGDSCQGSSILSMPQDCRRVTSDIGVSECQEPRDCWVL